MLFPFSPGFRANAGVWRASYGLGTDKYKGKSRKVAKSNAGAPR
jgi:hypothetical protein